MTDVTDLLEAFVAIAKDPKAWEKRVADMREAAGNLAEARKAKKDAETAAAQAAKDVETAHYERGQADRAQRDTTAQAAINSQRTQEIVNQTAELERWKATFAQEKANNLANIEQREAALEIREREALKKLDQAQKLMADYDEAKHKAALKLAS
jgi:hypothetical protein